MKTLAAVVVGETLLLAACSSESAEHTGASDEKKAKKASVSSKDPEDGSESSDENGSGSETASPGTASPPPLDEDKPTAAPDDGPAPEVAPPPPEDPAPEASPPAPGVTPQPAVLRKIHRYKNGPIHLWSLAPGETHPGFTYDGHTFSLLDQQLESSRPLFECSDGPSFFLSIETNCEGKKTELLLGYLFYLERPKTKLIVRCGTTVDQLSTIVQAECDAASLPLVGPQGYVPLEGFVWP